MYAIRSYYAQIIRSFRAGPGAGSGGTAPAIDFRGRAWYNPNLVSRVYNVPGVIATIVMLMGLLLTTLAVITSYSIHYTKLYEVMHPWGLRRDEIPVEARIISVADIFDALTHERPYKTAWNMDKAFSYITELSGTKLDGDCVEALVSHREEVDRIQAAFAE